MAVSLCQGWVSGSSNGTIHDGLQMKSTALGQSVAKSKTGELWWVSECLCHHDGSFVRSVSAQINLGQRH